MRVRHEYVLCINNYDSQKLMLLDKVSSKEIQDIKHKCIFGSDLQLEHSTVILSPTPRATAVHVINLFLKSK